MASFSALISYLDLEQSIILNSSMMCAAFQKEDDVAFIDSATAKFIELVTSLNNNKRSHNLFTTLNRTQTKNGSNLLRSNILAPPVGKF